MQLSDEEWKKKLTPEQYAVLRQKGTETPFTGKFYKHDEKGEYHCAACNQLLFTSESKYDSDTPGLEGWPSFAEVASSDAVELKDDYDLGSHRIEVVCKRCGSHLGHVFDDEASPTNKHYCINSVALGFKPKS